MVAHQAITIRRPARIARPLPGAIPGSSPGRRPRRTRPGGCCRAASRGADSSGSRFEELVACRHSAPSAARLVNTTIGDCPPIVRPYCPRKESNLLSSPTSSGSSPLPPVRSRICARSCWGCWRRNARLFDAYHDVRYNVRVVQTFADRGTKDIFDGVNTPAARKTCPRMLWPVARRRADQLNTRARSSGPCYPAGKPTGTPPRFTRRAVQYPY